MVTLFDSDPVKLSIQSISIVHENVGSFHFQFTFLPAAKRHGHAEL